MSFSTPMFNPPGTPLPIALMMPARPPAVAADSSTMLVLPLPKLVPAPLIVLSPLRPEMPCHWKPTSAIFVASTLTIIDSM